MIDRDKPVQWISYDRELEVIAPNVRISRCVISGCIMIKGDIEGIGNAPAGTLRNMDEKDLMLCGDQFDSL